MEKQRKQVILKCEFVVPIRVAEEFIRLLRKMMVYGRKLVIKKITPQNDLVIEGSFQKWEAPDINRYEAYLIVLIENQIRKVYARNDGFGSLDHIERKPLKAINF